MTSLDQLPGELKSLNTRPLFSMTLAVGDIHAIGGGKRVSDISGGSFAGVRLSGSILPGGTDWQTIRDDATVLLDARIVLRTNDDALITMEYPGIRHGPPDVTARLANGEEVDPASYYFRIVPRFTTSAKRYDWLNRIVAIGLGHRLPHGPVYSIFEIL